MLGYLLAPLFLVVPLMVASVIAADAFAGEKERGTLEALLHAPVRERDLFSGKLIAAWLPALLVGVAGTGIYALVVWGLDAALLALALRGFRRERLARDL